MYVKRKQNNNVNVLKDIWGNGQNLHFFNLDASGWHEFQLIFCTYDLVFLSKRCFITGILKSLKNCKRYQKGNNKFRLYSNMDNIVYFIFIVTIFK